MKMVTFLQSWNPWVFANLTLESFSSMMDDALLREETFMGKIRGLL